MIFLRLTCLLAGILVLIAPPLVLFPTGGEPLGGLKAAGILLVLLLGSSGFFFIGMTGHRMRRSPPLRLVAGLLLAVPCLASLGMLWRGGSPATLWMCGLMLCLTAVLYMTQVVPLLRAPGNRPLRAREGEARR